MTQRFNCFFVSGNALKVQPNYQITSGVQLQCLSLADVFAPGSSENLSHLPFGC
jgi:hypothetical protein